MVNAQVQSSHDQQVETSSHRDSMLLAKVPPRATFKETVDAVWQRSRDPKRRPTRGRLEDGELLIIPKLSFNVLREYPELVGLRLPDFDSRLGGAPGTTQNVSQGIAFVLNERGAELESFAEAGIIGSDGGDEPTPNPRQFVFDRPFLVLLGERAALEPYFALWLENVELMEAATPMSSSESPGGVGTSRR